jgi:hypothetical protein
MLFGRDRWFSIYFTTAVKTSSIATPVLQPAKGTSCWRLSVQMG